MQLYALKTVNIKVSAEITSKSVCYSTLHNLKMNLQVLPRKLLPKVGMIRLFSSGVVEEKVRVKDWNINYVKSGNGEKGVILLPGALGSASTDFKPQIEALPHLLPNHSIIAWDPPGYGKSQPPKKNFNINFYHEDADYAHELMKILNFEKYSILGWSDGGITGMIMAGMHKEAVQKLAIWGSNAYVVEEETKIYNKIRDVSNWSEKMRKPMEDVYGKEEFPRIWGEWIDTLLEIYKVRKGDICKNLLKDIQCPTFILHGTKDPMVAPEHVPYLKENIAKTELYIFPEGKHNIHLRYPKEFNDLVSKFLLK